MLKRCCTTVRSGLCSQVTETPIKIELAQAVTELAQQKNQLDNALYEIQILESAVKSRDKKIKFLEDNINTQNTIIMNLRSDRADKNRKLRSALDSLQFYTREGLGD